MMVTDSSARSPWSFPFIELMTIVAIVGILAPITLSSIADVQPERVQQSAPLMSTDGIQADQMLDDASLMAHLRDMVSRSGEDPLQELRTILQ